ncbi:paralemmin-3 isoform X2 [Pseudorasbora parva]|uniref:paralemmin-3 isoform X2 n=1 Tax=Pseudorasbora parva TaxID=51549 RepID=UPI00351E4E5A
MEHEAEKYQQRLQAIAEKRRIQEEQERARREMEDERLRLQQLKRKSLRDQWLMEGPLASPDSTGPRSPLWGQKAQEIETHINKLQVTSERLAEEEFKLKKLIEDGSTQTGTDAQTHHKGETVVEAVGTVAETAPNGPIMENGKEEKEDNSVHAENHDMEEEEPLAEATKETDTITTSAVVNGNGEGETSHNTPGQDEPASTNGFASHPAEGTGAGGITMTFLGFKEVEPGHGVDEDDDGGAIIRAERVIITDEGEEIPEKDDSMAQEPTTDAKNEDTSGSTEAIGAEEKTQYDPEASVVLEEVEVIEDAPAEEIVTDVAVEGEEQTEQHLPDSTDTQAQDVTVDSPIEASHAPMYSTTEPSPTVRPKVDANATESQTPKDKEVMPASRISLSQFQEVPLDESTAAAETVKQRAEQEPLLISKAAAQLDTVAPNRAEDAGAPKRKNCQCCSVM